MCSLWVGGLTDAITPNDLRDHFYAHGEITEIKILKERRSALVTYSMRQVRPTPSHLTTPTYAPHLTPPHLTAHINPHRKPLT